LSDAVNTKTANDQPKKESMPLLVEVEAVSRILPLTLAESFAGLDFGRLPGVYEGLMSTI